MYLEVREWDLVEEGRDPVHLRCEDDLQGVSDEQFTRTCCRRRIRVVHSHDLAVADTLRLTHHGGAFAGKKDHDLGGQISRVFSRGNGERGLVQSNVKKVNQAAVAGAWGFVVVSTCDLWLGILMLLQPPGGTYSVLAGREDGSPLALEVWREAE